MSTDKWVIRTVVVMIGTTVLLALGGSLVLAYQGKPIDDFFKITTSAALGALSALLAKTGYDRLVNVEQADQVGPQNPPAPPVGFGG